MITVKTKKPGTGLPKEKAGDKLPGVRFPATLILLLMSFLLTITGLSACSQTESDPASQIPIAEDSELLRESGEDSELETTPSETLAVTATNDSETSSANLLIVSDSLESVEETETEWLLNISHYRQQNLTAMSSISRLRFAQYRQPLSLNTMVQHYQQPLDTCFHRQPDTVINQTDPAVDPPRYIDVGDDLSLFSEGGQWVNLLRKYDHKGPYYVADNRSFGSLPDPLWLRVLHENFPQLNGFTIYEPKPVKRLTPQAETRTSATTVFTWVPDDDAAYVKISLKSYNKAGDFEGFAVTCWVLDDGEFEFPTAVKQFIETAQSDFISRYSRVYQRIDYWQGVAIHQLAEVSE